MARLLPPYVDSSCKSYGERMIFDILKNSPFSKDWIVLHSLNLSQHSVRLFGEIDFLILIPQGGVFVMEVKGGDVSCVDGVWYFKDRYGNVNKNKSPFNQARDAMYSLHSAIKRTFGQAHKLAKIPLGFCCAFPQISFDKRSIEYEQWQILDKDTIHRGAEHWFEELMRSVFNKYQGQPWFSSTESLPDQDDLRLLCDYLRGDFERVRTAEERLLQFDKEVAQYTSEQFRILDSIQINQRSVTQGSAGTGKTMLALESALRSASEGKRVFLTCYNRLIGEWMQKQLNPWKDHVTVASLHSFLFEQSKGFDYDINQGNNEDFYGRYLPTLLKDIYDKGIAVKFDKLIVDEAQDLIQRAYLELFDSMITGGLSGGNWEMYGDFESQAIYAKLSKEEMMNLLEGFGEHSRFRLRINCRNTKQIGEETSLLSGFKTPPFLLEHLEGLPVEYLFYKDEASQKQMLTQQLTRLAEAKVPWKEVIILSPKTFEHSCSYMLPGFVTRELKHSYNPTETQPVVKCATVQSFKGMERNYVVITDIGNIKSDFAKSLLYVGMSRARYGLIILISEVLRNDYRALLKQTLS